MKKLSEESIKKIKEAIGDENIFENEPLKNHAFMQIGGPAAYFFTPKSEDALAALIAVIRSENYPYYIVGNCTNILFRDEGYDGAIVQITEGFDEVLVNGEEVDAGAGISNERLSEILAENELSGFEFASGIPGCLGGGAAMNAGAYDGEMKDIIQSVKVLKEDGKIEEIPNEDLHFGYRMSDIQKYGYIVLGAKLKLKKGKKSDIQALVDDLTQRRKSKQPLEYPSCGSVFKRPEGHFAGGLITDSHLKGFSIGGAQVSEKHAGFIINKGGATACDVLALVKHIQETVKKNSGIDLVCEIRIV